MVNTSCNVPGESMELETKCQQSPPDDTADHLKKDNYLVIIKWLKIEQNYNSCFGTGKAPAVGCPDKGKINGYQSPKSIHLKYQTYPLSYEGLIQHLIIQVQESPHKIYFHKFWIDQQRSKCGNQLIHKLTTIPQQHPLAVKWKATMILYVVPLVLNIH
ncbi:uncharacterized protein VP01_2412g3 [Puccinia sorghi]|uniref:Uncharacterized protein n=1 Tax=Puccinia sorghi TaxID=27349 RepID=A0A0L6V6L9_9BASI|nr:uncharacterized protein VP01_2412g3 [Puccinia sorghi]